MSIKAILFDLDDTLLNSSMAEYDALDEFKQDYEIIKQLNNKELRKIWHRVTTDGYNKYFEGKITFKQQQNERMKAFFSEFGENISYNESIERYSLYKKIYKEKWAVFEDAIELLDNLKKNYKLAIITNGDSNLQREKIEKVGIEKYFSEIIISGEVGCTKPSKEIFEIACKKLNVNPEECIMVGDKLDVDAKGAENAGMTGIWINRKDEDIAYKYKINELKEINKYI